MCQSSRKQEGIFYWENKLILLKKSTWDATPTPMYLKKCQLFLNIQHKI